MTDVNTTIESVLQEQRVFEPPADTSAKARIGSLQAYRAMADAAKNDPDAFWGEAARRELHWSFKALVDRIDSMWFAEGKNDFSYHPHYLLRAMKSLHIEFKAK